jgi:DNA repair protein RadC
MYKNSIKTWSVNDRPREKFIQKGSEALSDSELLAILIRSGTPDRSALVVAQEILSLANDNLSLLAKLQLKDLLTVKGIGHTKAITLMTALELGKRRRLSEAEARADVSSSKDVYDLMKPLVEDLEVEQFWVLYLNNANKVLDKSRISQGGMTATIVDVRVILKKALKLNSTGIILCHNHPSGTLRASEADCKLTEKVKVSSKLMDIQLLDHIIVTDQSYFSFADEGMI